MDIKQWNYLTSKWNQADHDRSRQEHTASIFFDTLCRDDLPAAIKLIQQGCSPNMTLGQRTALMICAEYGAQQTLSLLIRLGANLGAQDEQGRDVLFWAIHCRSNACVDILLSQPHYRYKRLFADNSTALIAAAKSSYVHGVYSIVKHDSTQVPLFDRRGQTALWHVLSKPDPTEADNTIARILMDEGADPDMPDLMGATPRSVAQAAGAQAALEHHDLSSTLQDPQPSVTPDPVAPAPKKPGLRL